MPTPFFKPGQSGNPSGKPKGAGMITKFLSELAMEIPPESKDKKTRAQLLSDLLWKKALAGSQWASEHLMIRLEGKPKEVIQFEGSEKFGESSSQELQERLTALAKRLELAGNNRRNNGDRKGTEVPAEPGPSPLP
jgi:hypothetical protein